MNLILKYGGRILKEFSAYKIKDLSGENQFSGFVIYSPLLIKRSGKL